MCKGIHVLHHSRVRADVLRSAVGISELSMCAGKEHPDRLRMAVHHRFLSRPILDPHHSNSFIFEFDLVMLRVNSHWIIGNWLGHSCSCHNFLLRFDERDKSSPRHLESTLWIDRLFGVARSED